MPYRHDQGRPDQPPCLFHKCLTCFSFTRSQPKTRPVMNCQNSEKGWMCCADPLATPSRSGKRAENLFFLVLSRIHCSDVSLTAQLSSSPSSPTIHSLPFQLLLHCASLNPELWNFCFEKSTSLHSTTHDSSQLELVFLSYFTARDLKFLFCKASRKFAWETAFHYMR